MLRTVFCCLILVASFAAAKAEPIVITSGNVVAQASFTTFLFNDLDGEGFHLWAYTNAPNGFATYPCRSGCAPGQTISLGANTGPMGEDNWSGVLNNNIPIGRPFLGPNAVNGAFNFIMPSVLLPSTTDPTLTFTSSFIATGQVFLFGATPPAIFSYQYIGYGTATIILSQSNGRYGLQSATYTFAAPTPEPTTMILLCSGLVGLVFKLRSRRV